MDSVMEVINYLIEIEIKVNIQKDDNDLIIHLPLIL